MLDIRLSLSLSNDGKHGQVGRDYSSCVKGCWFGSNHDCIGFVNTADTLMFWHKIIYSIVRTFFGSIFDVLFLKTFENKT